MVELMQERTIREAWNQTSYVALNRPPVTRLVEAFKFHRQKGFPASVALARARQDATAGKDRYKEGSPIGPAFVSHGATLRFVERPADCGLRLLGLASELADLRHTGWYLDSDFQSETVQGVVYLLPGAGGRSRLLAGYADPWQADKNGQGPACLEFEVIHADSDGSRPEARDAAHRADRIAELMAEDERDYREAYNAGSRYADLASEIADHKESTLALIAELRRARSGGFVGSFPRACEVLLAHIRSHLSDIQAAREKRRELFEGGHGNYSWRAMGKEALAAFNDGAGIA